MWIFLLPITMLIFWFYLHVPQADGGICSWTMETVLSCITANLYLPELPEITPVATCSLLLPWACFMIHSNHNHSDVSTRQSEKHWTAKAYYLVHALLLNNSLTAVNNFITIPMFANPVAFPAENITMSNEAVVSSHKQNFICWHGKWSSHHYFLSSSSWPCKYY